VDHPRPAVDRLARDAEAGPAGRARSAFWPVLAGNAPAFLAVALALAFLAAFVEISEELFEGELAAADHRLLAAFQALRTPALTRLALDVTALGSTVVLSLFTCLLAIGLVRAARPRTALLLATAAVGAAGWTALLKQVFERRRPDELQALASVTGLSYPSGHSLASAAIYGTAAVLLGAHRQGRVDRVLAGVSTLVVLAAIGMSRIYLGVHYPSDVLAGFCAGLSWAFVLLAIAAWMAKRRAGRAPTAGA